MPLFRKFLQERDLRLIFCVDPKNLVSDIINTICLIMFLHEMTGHFL